MQAELLRLSAVTHVLTATLESMDSGVVPVEADDATLGLLLSHLSAECASSFLAAKALVGRGPVVVR